MLLEANLGVSLRCIGGILGGAVTGGVANAGPAIALGGAAGDAWWGAIAGAIVDALSAASGALGGALLFCGDEPQPGGGTGPVSIAAPNIAKTPRKARVTAGLLFLPLIAGGILS